jgi:hypothetical protein
VSGRRAEWAQFGLHPHYAIILCALPCMGVILGMYYTVLSSVAKYWLIINYFVVAMANLTIYVWDAQQDVHCEDCI